MWTEPGTWACCHSMGSRTSPTVTPSGIGSGSCSMVREGIADMVRTLLEQLGQPPVGQRLAAGLAGGAVLQARVSEGYLAHGVAAHRALLSSAAVHRHVRLLLALQLAGGQSAGALHGVGEDVTDRGVQGLELGVAEA